MVMKSALSNVELPADDWGVYDPSDSVVCVLPSPYFLLTLSTDMCETHAPE
jgi:hypothetical protein